MRKFILSTYQVLLRAQGGYLLILAGLSLSTVPSAISAGTFWPAPLGAGVIAVAVALMLVVRGWTPRFLVAPVGFLSGLGAMFSSSALFMLGVFAGYCAVIGMGLPEPLSKSVAILSALPTVLMTGLLWWLALALGMIVKPDAGDPPATGITPRRPAPRSGDRAARHDRIATA